MLGEIKASSVCWFSPPQELISQAAQILGSVDFLGNPMGLLNDVTEGVSELIKYGNVGGLIRNVTHGVSNSAAKVRQMDTRTPARSVQHLEQEHQRPSTSV